MDYTMLDALNDSTDSWTIKVQVCRIWESISPHTGEQISLNIILSDENFA
ncbi:hypothetical protein OROMI_016868 [Orobanche minor]